jgi:hypothetical protein
MTKTRLTLLAIFAVAIGSAAAASEPGLYGRLDLEGLPKPDLIHDKPVKATSSFMSLFGGKPVYVHVRPGDELHWARHCKRYDACSSPVLFVTESWFLNVYLPRIGSDDGREQRYREQMGRQRLAEPERRYDARPD